VLKTPLTVKTLMPHKDGIRKSESEITMCDRMRMCNISEEKTAMLGDDTQSK
jgi:hypothetical protein